jgi:hypothetical protein
MVKHYVPNQFCHGVIIQLDKDKQDDLTDSNSYRGITVSPTISKFFLRVVCNIPDCLSQYQPKELNASVLYSVTEPQPQ